MGAKTNSYGVREQECGLGGWQLYSWYEPPVLWLVPSRLPLSTHLPTSKGYTAELAVGCWLAVCSSDAWIRAHVGRSETTHLNYSPRLPSSRLMLKTSVRAVIILNTFDEIDIAIPVSSEPRPFHITWILMKLKQALCLYLAQICIWSTREKKCNEF